MLLWLPTLHTSLSVSKLLWCYKVCPLIRSRSFLFCEAFLPAHPNTIQPMRLCCFVLLILATAGVKISQKEERVSSWTCASHPWTLLRFVRRGSPGSSRSSWARPTAPVDLERSQDQVQLNWRWHCVLPFTPWPLSCLKTRLWGHKKEEKELILGESSAVASSCACLEV